MSDRRVPRWCFASDFLRQELKDDCLSLLAGAQEVKSNAVRQVFRNGDYYIKLDRRAGKSFKGEFKAAQLCIEENIPAVEHLAWGRTSEGSWLITRAADGFAEAASLFRTRQRMAVHEAVAVFLKKIFDSKIYHPDLHLGNILVEPESCQCLLVDLHGVRKRHFFDFFKRYMMHRCIMEFRNTLSDGEMFRLIELCGIGMPERFFKHALAREAKLLQAVMPRRRRQILNGYFKYTRLESSGRLVDIEAEPEALSRAEEISDPEASELFLFHFFLTQAKIPHRRILAFDPENSTILLEKELPEKYRSEAGAAELCRRLKYYGISSREEDYRSGFLDNIAGVFRQ